MQGVSRNGEWYFLMGSIAYRRGWPGEARQKIRLILAAAPAQAVHAHQRGAAVQAVALCPRHVRLIAVAALLHHAKVVSVGLKAGFLCWAGASILALLLAPDKFCAFSADSRSRPAASC